MQNLIKKYKFLFLCISGLLTALTVVFPKVGFFEWITLIPAAMVLICTAEDKEIRLRSMYLYGAVFFAPFYIVIYHWFLYMYPLSFMEVTKSVAVLVVLVAWIGLSVIQTVTSSLIFLVFALIFRCRIFEKFKICAPFLAAALWAVIEWTQTIGWWGVPWGRLCLGQTETKLSLLSASVFGSYFVSFLIVAVNFCIAYILISEKFAKVLSAACIGMIIGNLIIGGIVKLSYSNDPDKKISFAAVQGNIALNEKWGSGMREYIAEVQAKYTLEAANAGADVIVWAETAFPYNLDSEMTAYFEYLAERSGATLIATCFLEDEEASRDGKIRYYNCLIEVREDGSFGDDTYAKQRLVPFAEFVPMRGLVSVLIPPLAELNMLPDDVLFGPESSVMHTEKGNIGGMICFDSVYENIALESVRNGAQIILVSTNDAWFEDSAENYMHTSQSKLRAIETGRYIVRAANTGISGIINPMGEFEQYLGILEEGYVIGDVYLRDNMTVYTVIGNAFVYVCLAGTTVLFGTALFLELKKKKARGLS